MPAVDPYESLSSDLAGGPARRCFAITPHDTNELALVTTAIYVGGAGDVAVKDRSSGDTVIFKAAPVGALLPVRTARVLSTGTTATNLVGLA